jgi:DNA-binding NtrC family response regulator
MDHFISRYFRLRDKDVPEISPVARQAFMCYSWPGNVRELENTCERIAQICTCGTVRIGCIAPSVLFHADVQDLSPAVESAIEMVERPKTDTLPVTRPLDDRLREVESNLIGWALRISDGNRSQAARLLKIKRSTLGGRITRCRLSGHRVDAALEHTTPSATAG